MSPYRKTKVDRAGAIPADLAAILGIATKGELLDLLKAEVADVIREETGRKAGIPVHIIKED
jgi:hypothetical protein